MNFIGVGPAELVVILVVALIFVGPQRLPRLAADLARVIREIRRYTGQVAAEFSEVIDDIQRETESDRAQWKEIGQGLDDASRAVNQEVAGAQADARHATASQPTAGPNGRAAQASPPSLPAAADAPDKR
jgi:sec-independent protein translocase protein TatB